MNHLRSRGHDCSFSPKDADLSVVLSGKFENPLCVKGKRVLVFNVNDWPPPPYGWYIYGPIIKEYYHDTLDVTGTTLNQAMEKIERYILKCSETENS